jgi:restriction system protein
MMKPSKPSKEMEWYATIAHTLFLVLGGGGAAIIGITGAVAFGVPGLFVGVPVGILAGCLVASMACGDAKTKEAMDKIAEYRRASPMYERFVRGSDAMRWRRMNGRQFEVAVSKLYKDLGYKVELGKGTQDGGVDIRLEKDQKRILVQCKRTKAPVGVAVIRELYGTLRASNDHEAWLVASGGWTRGVADFVKRGMNLKLLDLRDLVEANSKRK